MAKGSLLDLQQVAGNQSSRNRLQQPPQHGSRARGVRCQKRVREEPLNTAQAETPAEHDVHHCKISEGSVSTEESQGGIAQALEPWCSRMESILLQRNQELFSRLDAWEAGRSASGTSPPELGFPSSGRVSHHVRWEPEKLHPRNSRRSTVSLEEEEATKTQSSSRRMSSTMLPIARLNSLGYMDSSAVNKQTSSKADQEHAALALRKSKERQSMLGKIHPEGSTDISADAERSCSCVDLCRRVLANRRFETFFAVLLITNAIVIGAEVQVASEDLQQPPNPVFFVIHQVYAAMFLVELLVRMVAQGLEFFWQLDRQALFWNYADLFIVGSSLVEGGMALAVAMDDDSANGVSTGSKVRVLRIIRITRLLRIARTMRYLRGLRTLVYSIFYTLKALLWSLVLLSLIIYMFGIVLTDAAIFHLQKLSVDSAAELAPDSQDALLYKYFGTLQSSMHTLFQSISGGVDWASVVDLLFYIGWHWGYFFTAYISFCSFAVLNVMTAIFCQRAMDMAERDQETSLMSATLEQERIASWAKKLFKSFDAGCNGSLTLVEFQNMLQDESVTAQLVSMDLGTADAWSFFRLLDENESGDVSEEEFVAGCLKLRGGAKAIDVARLLDDNLKIKGKIVQMAQNEDHVESLLQSIAAAVHKEGHDRSHTGENGASANATPPNPRPEQQESEPCKAQAPSHPPPPLHLQGVGKKEKLQKVAMPALLNSRPDLGCPDIESSSGPDLPFAFGPPAPEPSKLLT